MPLKGSCKGSFKGSAFQGPPLRDPMGATLKGSYKGSFKRDLNRVHFGVPIRGSLRGLGQPFTGRRASFR